MTTPRERAARALYEREPLYFHPYSDKLKRSCVMPWEEADEGWRAPYFARVDAVLDAIRPKYAHAAEINDWIDAIKRGKG